MDATVFSRSTGHLYRSHLSVLRITRGDLKDRTQLMSSTSRSSEVEPSLFGFLHKCRRRLQPRRYIQFYAWRVWRTLPWCSPPPFVEEPVWRTLPGRTPRLHLWRNLSSVVPRRVLAASICGNTHGPSRSCVSVKAS